MTPEYTVAKHPPIRLVLGSGSPRRLELLSSLFPAAEIRVCPPVEDREQDLTLCRQRAELTQALLENAQDKGNQVARQLVGESYDYLLTADTTVLIPGEGEACQARGKPNPALFPDEVRRWFLEDYLGRTHEVMTAVCLRNSQGQEWNRVVTTKVRFGNLASTRVEWYLQTRESLGKAGGYAIQGLGSCFVEQLRGSLSNVIGLPQLETLELVEQAWLCGAESSGLGMHD